MKKCFLLLMSLPFLCAWGQDIDSRTYGKIKVGETRYLLSDKVNLRKDASAKAELVVALPIASKVKILAKHDSLLTLYGYKHHWFQVALLGDNDAKTGVEGYLWGGFFAEDIFSSKNDPEVKFLYGISKIVKNDWEGTPYIQIRAVMGQKEIDRLDFQAVGSITTFNSAKALGNKGLRNVAEIFHFNFSDEMCAGAFGDVYVFWDKAILHHAKTLTSGADAPYYSDESFIFPTDKEGKPGKVVFHEMAGGEDEQGKEVIDYDRKTDLVWTGCELKKAK